MNITREEKVKVAGVFRETLIDGNIKEAEAQISDYVKLRIREESVAKQLFRVRDDITLKSREVREQDELVDDANQLFKGMLENNIELFVRTKLAKYATAEQGSFTRNSRVRRERREYAYFPIMRIWTDVYEFDLDKLDIHSDTELITELENDFVYAFNDRLDAIVLQLFLDAIGKVTANNVVSANANATRADWKALIDAMEANKLLASVLATSTTRARDTFLLTGTDIGDHAGETFRQGDKYFETIAGLKKVTSVASPLTVDNVVWCMASSDYVGDMFNVTPMTIRTKEIPFENKMQMKGFCDVAVGLANIKGVARLSFT